jgi:cytoskeletal protein RodZ
MNRSTIVNIAVALGIAALIAAVFVFESRNEMTPATTTTTSTTTSLPTTTTTTTSTTTTTTTTTTTSTTSTTSTTIEPLQRDAYAVVVVNGSTVGERLEPTVQQLIELGYTDVRGLVGAVRTVETVIYYADGDANAGARMRADLELDVDLAPLGEAPPVAGRNDAQLMLYLGGA